MEISANQSYGEPLIDLLNLYAMPVLSTSGIVFELMSMITFLKIVRNIKNKIYFYLLIYSISDAIIHLIFIINLLAVCKLDCLKLLDELAEKHPLVYYFHIYFKVYLCNSLYSFNVLIELVIALYRYLNMSGKRSHTYSTVSKLKRKQVGLADFSSSLLLVLFLLLVSLAYNIPYVRIYKMTNPHNSAPRNGSFLLDMAQPIAIIYFVKDSILLVFVCALNLLIMFQFKSRFSLGRQRSLAGESHLLRFNSNLNGHRIRQRERSVSYMLTLLCLIFLLSHLPENMFKLNNRVEICVLNIFNKLLALISNISISISSYLNFFVYFCCSQLFRKNFLQLFS
nr:G protein-coupled receptor [Proales similis]